jgi:two-component system cell cycle sensor histidine kinase/response regulator CckA
MSKHVCLIVDDEEAIRTFLRAVLEKEDMHCLEATSASQALKIIDRIAGRIDIVVTDIEMPGDMDGIDLTHSIARSYPHIATILVSGFAETEKVKRGALSKLIRKPFAIETILSAVRDSLK